MNTCGGFLCHAEALKKHKNKKNETKTKVRMALRFENNCKNVVGKSVETFCWREFREITYSEVLRDRQWKHVANSY